VTRQETGVLDLFEQTGAYLKGHFRLSSGLHSPNYLQSALVLQHPAYAEMLGKELAGHLATLSNSSVDLVISPALGGLIIGHEVARALHKRFLFTERETGAMTLRRGFRLNPGERVAIVEDVITTGGSTREVIEVVSAAGAIPVVAGSIIDRSGGTAELGIPRVSLVTLTVEAWEPGNCPLCSAGIPVVKPGSRAA
jgi:orotate phosphoribosyltransferase